MDSEARAIEEKVRRWTWQVYILTLTKMFKNMERREI